MITIVNQVSSAWFDNKLLRKSLHNETNNLFQKHQFTIIQQRSGAPNNNFRKISVRNLTI